MENKAPGTPDRPEGYGSKTETNFYKPRQKLGSQNIQRAGLRTSWRVGFWFCTISLLLMVPTYIGPVYVQYVAGSEWLERATKNIWQRRNEKDWNLYMTQRTNSWKEYLGLKHYDISGETNKGEVEKYRR